MKPTAKSNTKGTKAYPPSYPMGPMGPVPSSRPTAIAPPLTPDILTNASGKNAWGVPSQPPLANAKRPKRQEPDLLSNMQKMLVRRRTAKMQKAMSADHLQSNGIR